MLVGIAVVQLTWVVPMAPPTTQRVRTHSFPTGQNAGLTHPQGVGVVDVAVVDVPVPDVPVVGVFVVTGFGIGVVTINPG